MPDVENYIGCGSAKEAPFPIQKAVKRASLAIKSLELEIVKEASHLLSVSKADYINRRVLEFIENNAEKHK